MRGVLGVTRIVFVNQFKSLWRQFRPGRLYKKPGFVVAMIFYVLMFLNILYLAYRDYVNSTGPAWFDPRPPDNWLLSLAGDILSALFLVYSFVQYFIRKNVMSIPPDLEFLLYQPLHAWEIYVGMLIGSTAFIVISLTALWAVFSFLIPWFAFLVIYGFTYVLLVIDPLFFTVSRILRRSGHAGKVIVVAQTYLLVGFTHTLFISYSNGRPTVSPFLSYPVKGPYILTLSLYESFSYLSFLIYLASALLVTLLTASTLGRRLDVSDFMSFRDAYEARLSSELRKLLRRDALTSWSSPTDALRRVVLEFTVYNPRLLVRRYVPIFIGLLAGGFLARSVLMNQGVDPITGQPYLTMFLFMVALLIHSNFLRELLVNDLKCLWIVRVYMPDLRYFSRLLMLKYTVAYLAGMTAVAGFVASLSLNPTVLATPLVMLPVLTLSVFTTLFMAALLVRRARHHEPVTEIYQRGGLPIADPISQVLLLPMFLLISITCLSVFATFFLIITGVLTHTHVMLISIASVFISYLLYRLLSRGLAETLFWIDIHF
ncbi:MAG: hypothetical protein QXS42_03520 [Zestosphaera sp.]